VTVALLCMRPAGARARDRRTEATSWSEAEVGAFNGQVSRAHHRGAKHDLAGTGRAPAAGGREESAENCLRDSGYAAVNGHPDPPRRLPSGARVLRSARLIAAAQRRATHIDSDGPRSATHLPHFRRSSADGSRGPSPERGRAGHRAAPRRQHLRGGPCHGLPARARRRHRPAPRRIRRLCSRRGVGDRDVRPRGPHGRLRRDVHPWARLAARRRDLEGRGTDRASRRRGCAQRS
jgi:hypothetical protein